MKRLDWSCLGIIAAVASFAPCAFSDQPPDPVNSDVVGNTAVGTDALLNLPASTQSGYSVHNTGVGYDALYAITTGQNNTSMGYQALYSNTTGKGNEAHGAFALYSNTVGIRNLGIGSNALYYDVSGNYNIALGFDAGYNVTGSNNIALGSDAGYNVTTGSNNILIGATGSADDNGTIQIGSQGTQTSTTIAGIYGTPVVSGSAVYVTSTGQLGVQGSSERFKTDIVPIPESSDKLRQLRPVAFHYKMDPNGVRQYGLIAEEVDKVYPELVIRDPSGKIQGVHYEELAPMLLSEVQKQAAEIRDLKKMLARTQAGLEKLQSQADGTTRP